MQVALIDNFDSFTYNLLDLTRQAVSAANIEVFRNDVSLSDIASFSPEYILISPGPGSPADAGVTFSVLERYASSLPIFGVCLGMQCINEFFGGTTVPCAEPVHGKIRQVEHCGTGLFSGLSSPLTVGRYHSLKCHLAPAFDLLAGSTNLPMAIKHRDQNIYGVQFHPESFLSEGGAEIMDNFFSLTMKQKKP